MQISLDEDHLRNPWIYGTGQNKSDMNLELLVETLTKIEAVWSTNQLRQDIFGFQIQPGTRWLPALSQKALAEYQSILGFVLPDDLRQFYLQVNGTDLPTVDLHGGDGRAKSYGVGVYSYPRDIDLVERMRLELRSSLPDIVSCLHQQGVDLGSAPEFVPIYSHRFVIVQENLKSSVVCSIFDRDAIVYGENLEAYLNREFL